MEDYTDKKIITKQVIINYVEKNEAHLLPITADEKVINEIQSALGDYERLQVQHAKAKKLLALYKKVNELQNTNDEYNKLLERFNLTGGFGNWYVMVKKALNKIEKDIEKAKDLQKKYGEAKMDDYFTHSSGRILGLEEARLILENLLGE